MRVLSDKRIAGMNDRFRKSGLGMVLTDGVRYLDNVEGLITAVQDFCQFTEDSDPYGEHDFGKLIWGDEDVFWKIDYYDKTLRYHEDPLSPSCRRIITVMLASEY